MKTGNTNTFATHPLQSTQWGEFREHSGVKVVQGENFQMTIHPVPKTPFTIGYVPKSVMPTSKMISELEKIGKENKCIFIQLEPNIETSPAVQSDLIGLGLRTAAHPLFTKYTFVLDLTPTEQDLLAKMHPKTRYNIRVAQRKNVTVVEDNSMEGFSEYLHLMDETTKRQGFYAHTHTYHKTLWNILKTTTNDQRLTTNDQLTAHLFLAKWTPEEGAKPLVLTAWMLFVFKDTLYYPYGSSSSTHRETMSSNLMMWEAIRFGKKFGLKKFDMWGALGPTPDTKDAWYGFHRFKEGYGPSLVEFAGSFDLVINPILYMLYKMADKLRWVLLKLKAR